MVIFGKEREYIQHTETHILGFFGPYRFLSNFEVCDVYYQGLKFTSSEAAYMAGKTHDLAIQTHLTTLNPSQARKYGQTFQLRDDWEHIKISHMTRVLVDKFNRHPYLKELLLATGDRYLEETNHWYDTFWGVCDGQGQNNLGQILMRIRESLK